MQKPTVDGPLTGVRVIDMTTMGMGPFACQLLGDHGADVIKLEGPEGDVFRHNVPQSSHGMSHTFSTAGKFFPSLATAMRDSPNWRRLGYSFATRVDRGARASK